MAAPLIPAPMTMSSYSASAADMDARRAGSRLWQHLGSDLTGAADDVLVARELGGADGPARVNLARRDADLGAHAELAAVGELRRCVVHDDRAVELVQEAFGRRRVLRDDRVRMRRAVAADVRERLVEPVDDANRDDGVEELLAPIRVDGRAHALVARLRADVAAHLATRVDEVL